MLARPARPVLSRLEPATPRLILEPLPLPAPPGHVSSSHFTVHEPHQHIAVSRLRVQGASTARVQADTSLPQPVRTRGPHTHPAYAVLTLTPTCSSGDSASPCFGLQEFLGAPGGAVEEVQEGNVVFPLQPSWSRRLAVEVWVLPVSVTLSRGFTAEQLSLGLRP